MESPRGDLGPGSSISAISDGGLELLVVSSESGDKLGGGLSDSGGKLIKVAGWLLGAAE